MDKNTLFVLTQAFTNEMASARWALVSGQITADQFHERSQKAADVMNAALLEAMGAHDG